MPSVDVLGNVGIVPPEQIVDDVQNANVGVTFGFTVTSNVTGNAHNPAVGVKVYVPDAVLLTEEGLHVPVIPLVDVMGNEGTVPLAHIVNVVPNVKLGVTFGATVTLNVAVVAHNPAVGVNV